ncbi:LysM domain-containing protein [Aquimarina longa]|uniref:LysM domain-containing protein n=1 Tax=Aquimarina longa TaxID=1080221 RepID=UPI0007814B05|nr:LysM domain-containing protein [Aquimarina longa]
MTGIYRTYKIKRGDTLQSIAKVNELDVEELQQYHNKRTEIYQHIITTRIPEFLQEIVLPPEGYGLRDGKEIWLDTDEPEPQTIKTRYYGKLNREIPTEDITYGVLKTIQSGTTETTIKYKISIRYYPENNKKYNYLSIDKISQTFINDKAPNLVADEMAVACTEVLYPLVLKIDTNGLLLDIQNHKAILKRWKTHKKAQLDYYKGSVSQKYVELFEQTLSDKNLLFYYLKNDWFYSIYFNNIYTSYNDHFELNNTVDFPVIPNTKSVEYTVDKQVHRFIKNDRIKIEIDGKCTDPRSKSELKNQIDFPSSIVKSSTPVKGIYRAVYFLSPQGNTIQSAYMSCNLALDTPKTASISISEIDDIVETKRHPKLITGDEEETETKKKSFWKTLFS